MSFGRSKFRKIAPLVALIRELADKHGVDAPQIPIAWAISKGVVPIIGLTKPEQAVSLAQGENVCLSPEEIQSLEQAALDSGVRCKGVWE
jgi:aryl-alcohol dehydrogenase-like predicted oxidoreductase